MDVRLTACINSTKIVLWDGQDKNQSVLFADQKLVNILPMILLWINKIDFGRIFLILI